MVRTINKPKVGDTVYLTTEIYRDGGKVLSHVVIKLGRKYFYVARSWAAPDHLYTKIHLDTWHAVRENGTGPRCWRSMSEYEESIDADKLYRALREKFNGPPRLPLTIDQLKRIQNIVNEEK